MTSHAASSPEIDDLNNQFRRADLMTARANILAGKKVKMSDLQAMLQDEYDAYLSDLDAQKAIREEIQNPPDAVVEYNGKLKLAMLAYSRYEKASRGKNHSVTATAKSKSDKAFEEVYEWLEQIIANDRTLEIWFDRPVIWDVSTQPTLDPVSAPRVVTSKSLDNNGGGIMANLRSKKQLKIDAIARAIDAIDNPPSNQPQAGLSPMDRLKRVMERQR